MLTAEVLCGWPAILAESAAWQDLLDSCRHGVLGPDDTCSPLWAQALASTHLKNAAVEAIVVRRDGEMAAFLPVYRHSAAALPLPRRELRQITEAHSGRSSLLVRGDDPGVLAFLLSYLMREQASWDVFVFGVVDASPASMALQQAISLAGVSARCISMNQSPYVELAPTWDEVFEDLPKKMRWTIRKGERDLTELGQLHYEEVTDAGAVASLLGAIYEVERNSWKERSGTSITSVSYQREFYDSFVDLAARDGVLSAHVLRLSRRPIAYILGTSDREATFLDHKESFDMEFSEHSPGHLLKKFAIERLIARGVKVLDLMGVCEPYKMRWTSRTYTRLTVGIYNRTVRGCLHLARASVSKSSTKFPVGSNIDRRLLSDASPE